MRNSVILLVSGIAMLCATGCTAQEPLENWQKTQHFERAVSDSSLARMLEQLSQRTVTDMVMAPDGPLDAIADAGFTVEESDTLIRRGYAPYSLQITEYAHRQIADALSQDDIDALFSAGTDPQAIEAVMCAYGRPAVDGQVDWDGCTAQGFVELPEDFRDAHVRYSAAYQAVVDSPRTQTYFGGVSCRVLDQVAARLTSEQRMIDFDGTTLGMRGQPQQDCVILKADLDALDQSAAQGS
ncbi:hypothetical protein [Alteriqipengyuania sp.]|uniref:hypothetical protein n=1 Tax=Alteriqipengyuania sp. TaxID=2800692 RepID=UPI0035133C52